MFETYQGPVVDLKSKVYLRPEIAQGIFINFMNIQRTSRLKIPFGVGQIGKSFRNEVTPRNFIFRTREFEQMELEYFVKPGEDEKIYNEYINKVENFLKILGLKNTTRKKHNNKELAHYAKATTDIEYDFPFGKGELLGISNRTDYDLKNHAKHSGKKIEYKDPNTNEKYIPYVIEPSIGVDRLMLALLIDAYKIEELKNDKRIILKLDKKIAPYKIAVVPLNKKNHSKFAKKILNILLNKNISTTYDENGSIGRRYRRQDAIGTPYVITIIDKTKKEKKVTIRHRDTMKQEEIFLDEIDKYL
jgi:glycyl-tRNA synthetase